MRKTPASSDHPDAPASNDGAADSTPHALARQLYTHAIAMRSPVSWNLFHDTGDILFTAEASLKSRGLRAGQAALRREQCLSLGRYPRFSHVLLCVTPGLYIESTSKEAVHAVRAEEYERKERS